MSGNGENTKEITFPVSVEWYQENIIEMAKEMRSEDYLFKIYHYILAKYRREKEAGN